MAKHFVNKITHEKDLFIDKLNFAVQPVKA